MGVDDFYRQGPIIDVLVAIVDVGVGATIFHVPSRTFFRRAGPHLYPMFRFILVRDKPVPTGIVVEHDTHRP